MSDKMPLSEIRRILERGEWWDNVRDVSPDEPCPWLDELNGAIEAVLDELQAYHDAEADGWLALLPVKIGQTLYTVEFSEAHCCLYVAKWTIFSLRLQKDAITIFCRGGFSNSIHCNYGDSTWRNMYMTRAEAEAALKEREARHGRTTDKPQC